MAKGKSSKRGTAMTVGAVGLLGVGIWLGSQFDGFGPGGVSEGFGTAETEPPAEVMATTPIPGERPDLELPPQTEPGMAEEPIEEVVIASDPDGAPEMVAVQVREGQYLLSYDGRPAQEATLDQIAAAAESTTGTREGLRVRIHYHESARGVDDNALKERLAQIGLEQSAIQTMAVDATE